MNFEKRVLTNSKMIFFSNDTDIFSEGFGFKFSSIIEEIIMKFCTEDFIDIDHVVETQRKN